MMDENREYVWLRIIPLSLMSLGVVLIVLPQLIVFLMSINPTPELAFPPKGISLRWYVNMVQRAAFLKSVWLSLLLATVSTGLSITIALFFSLAVVRYRFIARNLLNALILSPMIIPEVVTGLGLLYVFNRMGMYNTIFNLLILHVFITLPYCVRAIAASLYRFDISMEEAAMALGASPLKALFLVTLPLIKPGLVVAAVFSFVISFENFTATMFLVTRKTTLPVEIFSYIRTENDPTVAAISTFFILVTVIFVVIGEKVLDIQKIMR